VFVTGLAMRTGWLELPSHLSALAAIANPWVLGAALIGLVAEFFADKIPVGRQRLGRRPHRRQAGGRRPPRARGRRCQRSAWQIVAVLLGGGGALLTHSAKASSRALVNASPEPVSNVIVSSAVDVATGGLLALALAYPVLAVGVALLLLGFALLLLVLARRAMKALLRLGRPAP
jgi:hypothetical protein